MKHLIIAFLLLQYTLSVDVDLALFNVTVLDNDGHAVSGLTAENFRVFEGDNELPIKVFEPEDSPATVGLVIDNSGSMVNKRKDVVLAATAFVSGVDSSDELFIVNFNRRAWMGLPSSMQFTNNVQQLRSALLTITADGTTALYDAMEMALTHLEKGTNRRKAIVLLSDGADNASFASLENVQRLAQRSSATIYTIGIYDPNQRDRNPEVLRELARMTGGKAYFPRRPADLREIWYRIAGSIRGQYTIGFAPAAANRDGSLQKVRINAVDQNHRKLDVKTRPGYYASSSLR